MTKHSFTLPLTFALALAATSMLAGCFEKPKPECAFRCKAENQACPQDYSCRADDWCKRTDVADDFVCTAVPAADARVDDASSQDAPLADAAATDASTADAKPADAMPADADPPDADPPDAMPPDAMPPDAMQPDAMPPDAMPPT